LDIPLGFLLIGGALAVIILFSLVTPLEKSRPDVTTDGLPQTHEFERQLAVTRILESDYKQG
jgi:hypothetical protein